MARTTRITERRSKVDEHEPSSASDRRHDYQSTNQLVPAFMAPKSINEVKELAKMIALAEWAPECYRDLDGNYLQPKIELAIMHGATVGLGPIAAVQSIAVINGMPSIWGDGALSIIEHSDLLEDMIEEFEVDSEEGLVAVCTMKRRDRETPIVNRFSNSMAEHAGLTRVDGPWQSYPQRMLRMRARSWTMRDAFADVLRGLHIREEVEDFADGRNRLPVREEHRGNGPTRGRPVYRPRIPSPGPAGLGRATKDHRSTPPPKPAERSGPAPLSSDIAPADQTFALVDADGAVAEIVGAEALRVAFERVILDRHLSPNQTMGVWESNEPARNAIVNIFGAEALGPAEELLSSLQVNIADVVGDSTPLGTTDRGSTRSISPAQRAVVEDDPAQLEIDPGWGTQKIYQHYRASLSALQGKRGSKSAIAQFRQANLAVEQRLRAKLPGRINELDMIFAKAGL